MKATRNIVWLVPLFLIVTFPLWRIPVGDFLTPRGGFDPNIKNPKQGTHNFNMDSVKILQNQNGITTAIIKAESARTGDNPDIFILEKVDADLIDEDNNITHIISKTGKYNTINNMLTLIDDVVVNKTHDNQFLYTDLLYYDSDKRTVDCPDKTKLIGDNVEIDGGNLHYDIKSARYDIGGRVFVLLDGFIAE